MFHTESNIIVVVQCTPDNGKMVKREFRIKGKVPRERISDYLFLTTLVKGEFRLIGNFLLLPSCPDYPEYTVHVDLFCNQIHLLHLLHLLDLRMPGAGCSLSIFFSPSGIRPLTSSWHQRWYLRSSSRRATLAFSRSTTM